MDDLNGYGGTGTGGGWNGNRNRWVGLGTQETLDHKMKTGAKSGNLELSLTKTKSEVPSLSAELNPR